LRARPIFLLGDLHFMSIDISSNSLLQRLVDVGIAELPGNKLKELADYLESRTDVTGLAPPFIVASAIWEISTFYDEHDRGGGLKTVFLNELDEIIRSHIYEIQKGDPIKATAQARQLIKEIRQKLHDYRI
jgi:hypothetical protein